MKKTDIILNNKFIIIVLIAKWHIIIEKKEEKQLRNGDAIKERIKDGTKERKN